VLAERDSAGLGDSSFVVYSYGDRVFKKTGSDVVKEAVLKKSKILQAVHQLSRKREEKVYLVGGTIRDLFLERPTGADFDFATPGQVSQLSQELAAETGGRAFSLNDSFGTWRVVHGRGRKRRDIDFSPLQGRNITEDLRQRDFTVNSMAMDLREVFDQKSPSLIDPLHGLSDLRKGVLRANSEESLLRDPLRMLRAFRFASTLRLKPGDETLKMIQRNKKLILHSAWERIRGEFFLALSERRADLFLRELYKSGLLKEIFPEIEGWDELDQGAHHDFPLLEHSFKTVEAGELILAKFQELYPPYARLLHHHFSSIVEEGISRAVLFKFVAFFHDSGKLQTRTLGVDGRTIRFLDHDQEGERINAAIALRLRLSRKSVRIISSLTRQHMRVLSLSVTGKVTSRAKYRFFRDLGKEGIEAVSLALADGLAARNHDLGWPLTGELLDDLGKVKEVAEELLRYYYEEFSRKPPGALLDGREVMDALGLSQGKEVGDLLSRLREAEAAGMVRTREEALKFLKNLDSLRPFS
jgi:poly(A) polymerase